MFNYLIAIYVPFLYTLTDAIFQTELSPINTAIEAMEKKNRELRILIDSYKAQRETNANPLTMALNGTIDAVVQGGIKKYEEAFFSEEYSKNNPTDLENIMYLKRIIIDQVTYQNLY